MMNFKWTEQTEEPERVRTREENLIIAILWRAYKDATEVGLSGRDPRGWSARDSAVEWLLSNNEDPFSFIWCVEQCFEHPEIIIDAVRKDLEEKFS